MCFDVFMVYVCGHFEEAPFERCTKMERYIAKHPNDQNPRCSRTIVKCIRMARTCPRGCPRPLRIYPPPRRPTSAEAEAAIPIESSASSSSSAGAEQQDEGSTTEEDPDLTEDEMPTYLGPFSPKQQDEGSITEEDPDLTEDERPIYLGPFSPNPEPEPEPELGPAPPTQTFYLPQFTPINAPPRSAPLICTWLSTSAVRLPTATSSTVQTLDTPITRAPATEANRHQTTPLQRTPQMLSSFSTIAGGIHPASSTVQTLGRVARAPTPEDRNHRSTITLSPSMTPRKIVHSQAPLFAPTPRVANYRSTLILPRIRIPRTTIHSPSPLFSPITPPPQDQHEEEL